MTVNCVSRVLHVMTHDDILPDNGINYSMSRQLRVVRRELTYQVYKSSGFNLFFPSKRKVIAVVGEYLLTDLPKSPTRT